MAPSSKPSLSGKPNSKPAAGKTGKEDTDKQKKETEKKDSSQWNVISLCLALLGVGAVLGYFIFYLIFRGNCANKLAANNQYHNSTQSELQTKYTKALADIRQCEEDSRHKGELFEMQGRLKAQADLSDKHQSLLERHEKTLERIQDLQQSSEGSQSQIQHLEEEINHIQSALEDSSSKLQKAQKERDAIQHDLKVQVDHTTTTLKERVKENSKLRVDLNQCESNSAKLGTQLMELKSLVQQQNLAQTMAKYGEGPFVVRFNLEFPSGPKEPNQFEVKIFNPRDMPHTVLTFLNMIDHGLYVDTTIDFKSDKIIGGGNPLTVHPKDLKSKLLRRFADIGLSSDRTLFFDNESSPNSPCRASRFSLNDRGPGFMIYMDDDKENNQNNCFGVIQTGRDTLRRIAESQASENGQLTSSIPIVAAHITTVDSSTQEEL